MHAGEGDGSGWREAPVQFGAGGEKNCSKKVRQNILKMAEK
jgi:hypothetical protein